MGSRYGEWIWGVDMGSGYGERIRGADVGLASLQQEPRHIGSRRSVRAVMDAQPRDVCVSSSKLQSCATAFALGTRLCLTVLWGLSFSS